MRLFALRTDFLTLAILSALGAAACAGGTEDRGQGHGGGGASGRGGTGGDGGSGEAGGGAGGVSSAGEGGGGAAGTDIAGAGGGGGGTAGTEARGGSAGTVAGTGGAGGTAGTGGDGSAGTAAGTGGAGGTAGAGGRGGGAGTAAGTGGRGGAVGAAGTGGGAGAAGSGGGSSGCSAPATSPPIGWAAVSGNGVTTTTGGGSAAPMIVTTLSQLSSAAAGTTARVIWVQGSLSGNVTIGSNKTIVGVCGAQIRGHVQMSGSVNVIVSNLKIVGYGMGTCALDPSYDPSVGCSSGSDAVTLRDNAHHVWFDHCDISDGTDGNLDITNAADFVTVSWTKFHYTPRTDNSGNDSTGASGHRYSNLVGGGDNVAGDVGKLNVTWHHNWWADNVHERQPRVRYGKNHIFNNYYSSAGDNYCVRAGIQAHLLLENNVFANVSSPHEFNSSSDQSTAYITATNNTYTATSGTRATGGGGTPFTTPPYSYTLDTAGTVMSAVVSGAGPH